MSYLLPLRICSSYRQLHLNFIYRKVHKQVIFSGIQPTGVPHLGNYFGAIQKWSQLQDEGKSCIFSIVDLHSITVSQDPKKLRRNIYLMTACLLACGINPKSSIFFLQSQVLQHSELAWILSCLTTMARLSHLPQYKEKSAISDNFYLGLYIYPVLQSADILLYKATDVPVGEDQVQHIQISQHLAKVFNNRYGNTFPVPSALTVQNSARIKSLRQPDKKMSKSDFDFKNKIDLTDPPDVISKRIREAMTDCTSAVTYNPETRPGVSNLILIHSLCSGKPCDQIVKESAHIDTGEYKKSVCESVIDHLKPIQTEVNHLMSDLGYIVKVLSEGSDKATELASKTMEEVKRKVGLTLKGSWR